MYADNVALKADCWYHTKMDIKGTEIVIVNGLTMLVNI